MSKLFSRKPNRTFKALNRSTLELLTVKDFCGKPPILRERIHFESKTKTN